MGGGRARAAGMEVSLFPFLSILACLIGALTLIITALSLSQVIGGRSDESVSIAEDYVSVRNRIADTKRQIEAERKALLDRDKLRAEWLELQSELRELRDRLSNIADPFAEKAALEKRMAAVKKRLTELRSQVADLDRSASEERKEVAELERLAAAGLPLRILPSGTYYRKVRPVFIEARAKEVVIHSPSRKVAVSSGELAGNLDFDKVATFVAADADRTIVFLVREDARDSYYKASSRARALGAVTSKVPLIGDGELDLSQFFNR